MTTNFLLNMFKFKCLSSEARDSSQELLSKRTRISNDELTTLLSHHRGQLAKKLFLRVNEHSLQNMVFPNFQLPKVNTSRVLDRESCSSRVKTNLHLEFDSYSSFSSGSKQEEGCLPLCDLNQVKNHLDAFEAHLKNALPDAKLMSTFSQAISVIFSVLRKKSTESNHIRSISAAWKEKVQTQVPSAEVSIAILTIACKKLKISKCQFVDLVKQVFNKGNNDILEKGRAYSIIVELLQNRQNSSGSLHKTLNPEKQNKSTSADDALLKNSACSGINC